MTSKQLLDLAAERLWSLSPFTVSKQRPAPPGAWVLQAGPSRTDQWFHSLPLGFRESVKPTWTNVGSTHPNRSPVARRQGAEDIGSCPGTILASDGSFEDPHRHRRQRPLGKVTGHEGRDLRPHPTDVTRDRPTIIEFEAQAGWQRAGRVVVATSDEEAENIPLDGDGIRVDDFQRAIAMNGRTREKNHRDQKSATGSLETDTEINRLQDTARWVASELMTRVINRDINALQRSTARWWSVP